MQKSVMTSNQDNWETPKFIFNKLNDVFHFDLDAAASPDNARCEKFLTIDDRWFYMPEYDSLTVDWSKFGSVVFINPPYNNRGILLKFFEKIKLEADKGLTIVALVAARTETKWFKIGWTNARYFCFFYKRIKFELHGQPVGSPTFPSVVIVFSNRDWDLSSLSKVAKLLTNPKPDFGE